MNRFDLPALTIRIIALIELSIGLITIFGLIFCPAIFRSHKPYNVLMFVLISSTISTILGYGIFKLENWARRLLIFFSGYVVLTKILLFIGLLELKGEMVTMLPSWFKNSISLIYHITLIVLLQSKQFRQEFTKTI